MSARATPVDINTWDACDKCGVTGPDVKARKRSKAMCKPCRGYAVPTVPVGDRMHGYWKARLALRNARQTVSIREAQLDEAKCGEQEAIERFMEEEMKLSGGKPWGIL